MKTMLNIGRLFYWQIISFITRLLTNIFFVRLLVSPTKGSIFNKARPAMKILPLCSQSSRSLSLLMQMWSVREEKPAAKYILQYSPYDSLHSATAGYEIWARFQPLSSLWQKFISIKKNQFLHFSFDKKCDTLITDPATCCYIKHGNLILIN